MILFQCSCVLWVFVKWFIHTKVHFGGPLSNFVVGVNLVNFVEIRRSSPAASSRMLWQASVLWHVSSLCNRVWVSWGLWSMFWCEEKQTKMLGVWCRQHWRLVTWKIHIVVHVGLNQYCWIQRAFWWRHGSSEGKITGPATQMKQQPYSSLFGNPNLFADQLAKLRL